MKKKAPAAKRETKGKKSGKKAVKDLEVKAVRGGSIKGGATLGKTSVKWK